MSLNRDLSKTGALFDLDGVIIDTEGIYTDFWAAVEREFPTGIPDFPVAIKGTTLPVILANYATDEIRNEITSRLMDFQASMPYRLFPGALDFLKALKELGIPAALITSSDDQKMRCVFAAIPELQDMFITVIDGSMVEKSKPNPEGYLRGARSIDRMPEDCFVFEDSMQGLAAGRASGATVIALSTTYPEERLQGLAHKIIPRLSTEFIDEILSL